jgi:hypothetical protein
LQEFSIFFELFGDFFQRGSKRGGKYSFQAQEGTWENGEKASDIKFLRSLGQ